MLGGEVVELAVLDGYAGLLAAFEDWESVEGVLRAWDPHTAAPLPSARVVAPVRLPRKILCSGANYRDHLAEMGRAGADDAEVPTFFFLKPATSVVGPGEAIVVSDPELQVDWEAELGVVIGRRGTDLDEDDALGHVAGYTVVNDISARGPHRRTDAVMPAFEWDWLASKGRDTYCPMGPGITPHWLVPEVQQLPIQLRVNGTLEQDSNTSEMINGVATLVAAASRLVMLEPGDIIATGTPAGVGAGKGRFLAPGDSVEVMIGALGTLTNPVVATAREAQ